MRLSLILPVVEPEQFVEPQQCVDAKCVGEYFQMRQAVAKKVKVRDMQYEQMWTRR